MKRNARIAAAFSIAALFVVQALPAQEAQASPWIHVEITATSEDGENIRVNLPVVLAELALRLAPQKFTEKARTKLEKSGLLIADLRELWSGVKAAGDAEFVSVQSTKKTVHISRAGDAIQIRVADDSKDKPESVRIDIPVDVVDALLGGDADDFDVTGAFRKLTARRGEIIRVVDADSEVRIWVDERKG